jgi:hypothetical protein
MPPPPSRGEPDPDTASSFRWFSFRVRRHVRWAREQGVGRLIEEDELDPFERIPTATRKFLWRRTHDARPRAVPVFVVGVQRSGTNMLVRGLEKAPEFEVHNENDRAAFDRFRLRSDDRIRAIVTGSRHDFVLFKPLCDSHRIGTLLDELGTPSPGKAVWAYRSVDGRVRSALAKFGDANLRALTRIAAGTGDALWQAQGLSEEHRELIRRSVADGMSPESAAALFWYLRNALYFELGLDERPDIALASYDAVVRDPAGEIGSLCAFLQLRFQPSFVAHIEQRAGSSASSVPIDPAIRELCQELHERLEDARQGTDKMSRPPEETFRGDP